MDDVVVVVVIWDVLHNEAEVLIEGGIVFIQFVDGYFFTDFVFAGFLTIFRCEV